MTAAALSFVAAFEVYRARMSGTRVLEAGVRGKLQTLQLFVHLAQPPIAAVIILQASSFAVSSH